MNTYLESALKLARAGYRVFPLEVNGKKPLIERWPQQATTAESWIVNWWRDNEFNIGVATGHGLVVIDADVKDDRHGLESLALLDTLGLPESMRVQTPSGGVHVYLKTTGHEWQTSVNKAKDYPGIDIRGEGGYVVGPGSTIDGVAYRVAE